MITVSKRRFGFRIGEVWHYNGDGHSVPSELASFDALYFRDSRVNFRDQLSKFRNGVLSLDAVSSVSALSFDKKFSYEVRRAEREGVTTQILDRALPRLEMWYKSMVAFHVSKNIPHISRVSLERYAQSNLLQVTMGCVGNSVIVVHVYLFDADEPVLLASFPVREHLEQSAQLEGKFLGWANRYLHFRDIEFFKNLGCRSYSLGGMGNPPTPDNQGIIAFKSEMNPITREDYFGFVVLSPRLNAIYQVRKWCQLKLKTLIRFTSKDNVALN